MHRVVQDAFLGLARLGHVGERSGDAHHLVVVTDDGTRLELKPMVLAFRVAQAKIDVDAAAPLLEHIVERGAIALAVEGVHHVEPARGRAAERAAREAKLHLDLGAHMHLVGGNVPVIDRIARPVSARALRSVPGAPFR